MDKKIIKNDIQPASPKLIIVHGLVENLPEILGTFKEIYVLNKKGQLFGQVLKSRLDEMNINQETFRVLVQNLTELSKSENADKEIKDMYRDMIKILFENYAANMQNSQSVSNFLKDL